MLIQNSSLWGELTMHNFINDEKQYAKQSEFSTEIIPLWTSKTTRMMLFYSLLPLQEQGLICRQHYTQTLLHNVWLLNGIAYNLVISGKLFRRLYSTIMQPKKTVLTTEFLFVEYFLIAPNTTHRCTRAVWKIRGLAAVRCSYAEAELCGGEVKVSFSKYLPWQAMHFLQRSTHFSKT
jgi:hypothetical protein